MSARICSRPEVEIIPYFPHDLLARTKRTFVQAKTDGLPENMTWFGAQIAGHKTQLKDGKQQLGFIKDNSCPEYIFKPVMQDKRGICEKNFYTAIFSSSAPQCLHFLRPLLPQYEGIKEITYYGERHELLQLEDISEHFVIPAIIDVKIGQRTFGPDASAEKMRKEQEKYPPQEQVGFRLLGYKIESGGKIKIAEKNREECLNLRTEDIQDALAEFFSHRGSDVHIIIDALLEQLKKIKIAAQLGIYHIFSSSLLIAYEADREAQPRAEIRMIDFSHVFAGNGKPDENYLFGVNKLVEFLQNIRNGHGYA